MRLVAIAFVLAACIPTPAPVAPVDADPNATPESACVALTRLSCPEALPTANGVTCPEVVRKAMRLRAMPLGCISAAPDVGSVRMCGAVRCRE